MPLFIQPCNYLKAEPLSDGAVEVTVKISSEAKDRQEEIVLKSAFSNPDNAKSFIREGIYDYNHLTDIIDLQCAKASPSELVDLQQQKLKAIIGSPHKNNTGLYVQPDGVYSKGRLIPDNQFVKDIIKGIKAGVPYGASISGWTEKSQNKDGIITNIQLRKIGIQPLQESINNDTYLQLAKSNIFTLTQILKGDGFPEVIAAGNPVISENEAHAEIADILKKVNLMYDWLIGDSDIQGRIASEINERLGSGTLPLRYEEILRCCIERYCMPEQAASDIANGILIQYTPENV